MISPLECIKNYTHLRSCDDDGYCNFCGYQERTLYQGRLWDAPFTDDAIQAAICDNDCILCQEPIGVHDDAVATTFIIAHLECHLRSALGDVQHLEGRCVCPGGSGERRPEDEYPTYREEAKATVAWLLERNRGRFRE